MARQRFVVHTTDGQSQAGAWAEDPEGVKEISDLLSEHGVKKFAQFSLDLENGAAMHFNVDHVVAIEIQTETD